MAHELTNLLPKDRLRALRQEYLFRFISTFVIALSVLVVIHGILLIPVRMLLSEQIQEDKAELAGLGQSLGASEEQNVSARINALSAEAKYLLTLDGAPSGSGTLRALLGAPRPGIALSGITYTPPVGSGPGAVSLTGTAATRQALRDYVAALSALPFIKSADLPISSYAQDSDIPFTIKLAGPLSP